MKKDDNVIAVREDGLMRHALNHPVNSSGYMQTKFKKDHPFVRAHSFFPCLLALEYSGSEIFLVGRGKLYLAVAEEGDYYIYGVDLGDVRMNLPAVFVEAAREAISLISSGKKNTSAFYYRYGAGGGSIDNVYSVLIGTIPEFEPESVKCP